MKREGRGEAAGRDRVLRRRRHPATVGGELLHGDLAVDTPVADAEDLVEPVDDELRLDAGGRVSLAGLAAIGPLDGLLRERLRELLVECLLLLGGHAAAPRAGPPVKRRRPGAHHERGLVGVDWWYDPVMRYLPFERLMISSELPPDVLSARLSALTDSPRTFRWPWARNATPLEGRVATGTFVVWPLMAGWQNGFKLFVRGSIEANGSGSLIRAVVRWQHVGTAIWAFMVAFVLIVAAALVLSTTRNDGPDPLSLLVGLLPVIIYGLPVAVFNWGASLVKRALADAARLK